MRAGLAAAVAASLLAAPAADASTVSVTEVPLAVATSASTARTLTAAGEGIEANVLSVHAVAGAIEVRDAGAQLQAGPGCTAVDDHTARCAGPFLTVEVDGGAGADRLSATAGAPIKPFLDGGSGDDTVDGSSDPDVTARLDGGPGADLVLGGVRGERVSGGGGTDELHAGGGRDILEDGDHSGRGPSGPGSDLLDGGPGSDAISYEGRKARVNVDVQRPRGNGEYGEDDRLISVERIHAGGDRDDALYGGDRNDVVFAPEQRDRVVGRGGDDRLDGSDLSGGPGDDSLALEEAGYADCGTGDDLVETVFDGYVAPDCERVRLDVFKDETLRLRLPLRHADDPVAAFRSDCGALEPRRCKLVMTLRVAWADYVGSPMVGTLLGRATRTLRGDRLGRLSIRLTRRGREVLRAPGPLDVRIDVQRGGDNDGVTTRITTSR